MAVFPPYLPSAVATPLAFAVYGLEKYLTGALHPRWTRQLGFTPLTAGNREACNVEEFIEIVLASSCVPPVLPGGDYRGQRVLDGGIIDSVPAHLADARPGRTLVLLSKRYRRPLPDAGKRIYVQPSEAIRIDKFDYANPQGLEETYDLGYRDGRDFAASMTAATPAPAEAVQAGRRC
jgi:predicted patatin/cPLA2 family phospholipase